MGQPRTHSQGNIPFSWERKPGVPKVTTAESFRREHKFVHKLQPPPYTSNFQRNSVDVFQIPLPPCAFQPPNYETFSKMQDGDPFYAAYKKCTKSTKSVDRNSKLQINTSMETTQTRLRNSISMSFISCKRSCAVRDNNLVRVSRLPQNVDEG